VVKSVLKVLIDEDGWWSWMACSPEQKARLSMARCNPIPLYNISRFPEFVVTTSHHLDSYKGCDQFQLLAS
jgi:hypothetical protein